MLFGYPIVQKRPKSYPYGSLSFLTLCWNCRPMYSVSYYIKVFGHPNCTYVVEHYEAN